MTEELNKHATLKRRAVQAPDEARTHREIQQRRTVVSVLFRAVTMFLKNYILMALYFPRFLLSILLLLLPGAAVAFIVHLAVVHVLLFDLGDFHPIILGLVALAVSSWFFEESSMGVRIREKLFPDFGPHD